MGLGMMRFPPSQDTVTNFIAEALKLGVTYIESCHFYINYQCEPLIGNALANFPRDSFELAAKCCYKGEIDNYDLENYFNEQLKVLKVDYFDYYLLQAIDRYSFVSETELKPAFFQFYNFLVQKQKEGKIKYIGFSFHDTPPYLEHLLKTLKWDFCQLQLNYYDWYLGYAKDLYFITEKYNIPIFVMGALKGGLLGDRNNIPPQYAYNFLGLLPNVKLILNGATDLEQLQANNQMINNPGPITKHELEVMKKIA